MSTITETVPTITAYTGTIPDKATQTPTVFANNVYPFHLFYNDSFITDTTAFSISLNTLGSQINTVADEVSTNATNAANSASAADTSETNALASENKANKWAEEAEDVEVEVGKYSAHHWATKAAESVATLPAGTINDALTDTTHAWSSSKISGELALKQPILASSYTQITDASLGTGTHTFDYANGDMQQLTATGNITIAFSNFVTGKVCSMIIDAVNWGAYTITLPVGMLFDGGAAPTFTASGTDRLIILKDKDDVYSMFIVGQAVGA